MRKEIFIVKNDRKKYFGWWIQDDSGWTYAYADTKSGAIRAAKKLIKSKNNPKPPIKEFIGEIE